MDATLNPAEASIQPSAVEEAAGIFGKILARYPKQGIAASSFGKYNEFREWLAAKVGLSDWERDTYATGASTTAHNFGSRWSQSNQVSGRHVPLGIGFVQVNEPNPALQKDAVNNVVKSVKDTSRKFVDGSRPTSYEAIIIFSRLNSDPAPTPEGILAVKGSKIGTQLHSLFPSADLTEVEQVAATTGEPPPESEHSIEEPVESVDLSDEFISSAHKDFSEANFRVNELLLKRSICSLVAKPFLILAGLSGSGKTQLAIALARWLSSSEVQRQVVAVGADWTSNQNLVGYPDALNENQYVSTPALDLILRALKFPTLPFFLILDEMNLSHVERYFSDLLSSIESGEDIHLYRAESKRGEFDQSIEMPRNLFILGTVNVDETTYMFSPKVLDRANVIEFDVDRGAIEAFLASPSSIDFSAIDGKGARFAKALVEDATTDLQVLSLEEKSRCQAELLLLFEIFDREGFPFAFRTAKEVVRFIEVFKRMSPEDWSFIQALDAQVLQRLMPKFHGDRGRLKRILMSLGVISAAQHVWDSGTLNDKVLLDAASNVANTMGDEIPKDWTDLLRSAPPSAQMPLTLSKTIRMLNRLRRDGFTTFIEA